MNVAADRLEKRRITNETNTFINKLLITASHVLRYSVVVGLLFLLAGHEKANPKVGNTDIEFYTSEFRTQLQSGFSFLISNSYSDSILNNMVRSFYADRNYMPAWTLNFEAQKNYHELYLLLISAREYGLFPQLYDLASLQELESRMNNAGLDESKLEARVLFERLATRSALKFMAHISAGVRDNDTSAIYQMHLSSLPLVLNTYINSQDFRTAILELQPKSKEYHRLQLALVRFLSRAAIDTNNYTFNQLSKSDSLLAYRLISLGFLDEGFKNDSTAIVTALKGFQKAHSLKSTGKLSRSTLKALSMSVSDKLNRIALNLDRLRKDVITNENCIVVNIPEFRLHYYNPKGEYKSFTVVVGKTDSRTPLLSSEMNRIVANPFWTVPKSITHDEILPKLRKDPQYLEKHGFYVIDNFENLIDATTINWDSVQPGNFNYWIRQENSSRNALGIVKFLFPNNHRVYLHDTPSKRFFKKEIRAYSHGCVRVENPEKLAQIIISDYHTKQADEVDFMKLVKSKERKVLFLKEKLPIHIRYYTCTADSVGNLYFHPDIYKYDEDSITELLETMERI